MRDQIPSEIITVFLFPMASAKNPKINDPKKATPWIIRKKRMISPVSIPSTSAPKIEAITITVSIPSL